eukprot:s448_g4.t1
MFKNETNGTIRLFTVVHARVPIFHDLMTMEITVTKEEDDHDGEVPLALTDAPLALTDAPLASTDAPLAPTDAPLVLMDAPRDGRANGSEGWTCLEPMLDLFDKKVWGDVDWEGPIAIRDQVVDPKGDDMETQGLQWQGGGIMACLGDRPVISSLDSNIWDVESLGKLKAALADKTTEAIEGENEKRAKQQDYSALPKYLTEEWSLLLEKVDTQEEREKALECVCDLAGKLGLRNGSEETYAFLYVLAFTMHPTVVVYDCEKQRLLQRWKPVMKRYLKQHPPLTGAMAVLPDKVEECPGMYLRAAFPNGWKAAAPRTKALADVLRLGRTWPLRITHAVASGVKNTEPVQEMTQLNQSVMGMAAAVAQQTTMALAESLSKEEELPGLKILKSAEPTPFTESSRVLPALMDRPADTTTQPSKQGKLDPQQMIDSLREDLADEKIDAAGKKTKETVKKKSPKAKSKGKGHMKRPAASGSKRLKRPAAALAAEAPALDEDPVRATLLSMAPSSSKESEESSEKSEKEEKEESPSDVKAEEREEKSRSRKRRRRRSGHDHADRDRGRRRRRESHTERGHSSRRDKTPVPEPANPPRAEIEDYKKKGKEGNKGSGKRPKSWKCVECGQCVAPYKAATEQHMHLNEFCLACQAWNRLKKWEQDLPLASLQA